MIPYKLYPVVFEAVAITALQDLFEVTAPANRLIFLHSLELMQTTDVADAAEEILRLRVRNGTSGTTSGSGGSSATPSPLQPNQGASGFTAEVNNTTIMSGGTIATRLSFGWNIRIPTVWEWYAAGKPPIAVASERLTVELIAAPADSISATGTLWVGEVG